MSTTDTTTNQDGSVRERLQTIQDYAKSKAITRQTVYNWITEGKVQTKKMFGKTLIVVE